MENKEYMDREIIKQAQIVLTMMLGVIATDIALKAFLYNLALLNSMAHKGYMAPRTAGDQLIYAVKQEACEWLAQNWTSRCRYYYGGIGAHSSVLYVYTMRRQYSFHVDLPFSLMETLPKAKYREWDGIDRGWSMDDVAYAQTLAAKRHSPELLHTESYEFKEMLKFFKAAKEYIRIWTNHRLVAQKFWDLLGKVLPARKLKNKCCMTHNLHECSGRYFDLVRNDFSEVEQKLLFFPGSVASYYDWTFKEKTRVSRIANAIEKGNLALAMLKDPNYFIKLDNFEIYR